MTTPNPRRLRAEAQVWDIAAQTLADAEDLPDAARRLGAIADAKRTAADLLEAEHSDLYPLKGSDA